MKKLGYKEQCKAAKALAGNWAGRGDESRDCQTFWNEILRDILGVPQVSNFAKFEHPTGDGGFIDCWIPDTAVLIEQKGIKIDLDKPEERRGQMVTPLQQALNYVRSFNRAQQPRFVVTCNFKTFRVYDRDKHDDANLPSNYFEFTLEELGEHPEYLDFIIDPENSRSEKEKQVSINAGKQIKQLYDALATRYIDPTSAENQHALNVLCVRLVFCLFCEDANGLFPKDAFLNYLRDLPPERIRPALKNLFTALNTPVEQRDPYDESIKAFPYVGGSLFEEETEIPNFDEDLRSQLLFQLSQEVDWSNISPTIFGGIFESTLNPETRRKGGMHYTSIENIHKVIDPLFLNDLQDELMTIKTEEGLTEKKRAQKINAFIAKLSNLKFLDPACGSGNFLTETYLCLRRLEDEALKMLRHGQSAFDFATEEAATTHVSLNQFFGIEINDFACRVAKVALWIAQLQSNNESEMTLNETIDDFPLTESPNIIQGNALRLDWNDVIPASECNYIMGNPPFLGARNQSKEQKQEVMDAFHGAKNSGNVDYVAAWYIKAAEYMLKADPEPVEGPPQSAFVSTNSICQGEQVAAVWKPIFDLGFHIDFAYRTFKWLNEASDMAAVSCIIAGFSKANVDRMLYSTSIFDHQTICSEVREINGYLIDASSVFISNSANSICPGAKAINYGSFALDDGNFTIQEDEYKDLITKDPKIKPLLREFIGANELLKGKQRWCLWCTENNRGEWTESREALKKIKLVQEWRSSSNRKNTLELAKTPWRFAEIRQPQSSYLAFPTISSERRKYIPISYLKPEIIASNQIYVIPDATLYDFGVLHSFIHNAWVHAVGGKLESRYRYSSSVIYNNFPWPGVTKDKLHVPVEECVSPEIREKIEACAQAVLDARDYYIKQAEEAGKKCSLADMYDPDNDFIYPKLISAHNALDAAVEEAYGVDFNGDEEKIVAHLFKLYAELTGE